VQRVLEIMRCDEFREASAELPGYAIKDTGGS
jgi:hypothetical protein